MDNQKISVARAVEVEADIAKSLLANISSVIEDDEEAILGAIEGETNLVEAIQSAIDRVAELAVLEDAIKARLDDLKTRKDRFARQADHIRTAIVSAMGAASLKKLELPIATLSCRSVPPKAVVTSEADIPSNYWKPQDPKLDLKGITDALKAGDDVPGATLSNGSETLSIRFK